MKVSLALNNELWTLIISLYFIFSSPKLLRSLSLSLLQLGEIIPVMRIAEPPRFGGSSSDTNILVPLAPAVTNFTELLALFYNPAIREDRT